jgi:SAM-dependent methyltransferase
MSDHDELTRQARTQWDGAAEAWRKWRHIFDQRTDPAELVELAGISAGMRVLDVGAGTGDASLAIAARVGADGSVTATDLSEGMLVVARERAEAAGLDNIEFVATAGHALDGVEPGFDAAVASLALMLVPDPGAVARRVHEVLRPGGRFAATVWAGPEKAPFLSLPLMVGASEFGVTPPPPGGPGLFALAAPGLIDGVLESAGFDDVSTVAMAFSLRFESPDEYVTSTKELAAPLAALLSAQLPDRLDEFWARVADTARERADSDGSVSFHNEMIAVSCRRP